MEQRRFGSTRRDVAVIGQGTWYDGRDRRESAIAALRRGIQLGMTHIDTAEMYLSGTAEEWVGEAIRNSRDEVFLVSKVLPMNASRKGTLAACERSLARLRTDHLDCYLLHWRTNHYPLQDAIEAFDQLQSQGKILSWGVSNFDEADLDEARRPACDQVLYHLEERAAEHAVIPWCAKQDCAFVAYSPFGHDSFPAPHTAGGRLLAQIAHESGATPRQVALRYLLRLPNTFAIPKSSDIRHTAENAAAGGLRLSPEQIARIDQQFPLGPRPSALPML